MSSLVSLRSYQKRRKSAGARLERPQSLSGMPALDEAHTHHLGGTPAAADGHRAREKRVKSARETRREQEASDVFPELERGKVDEDWGKTKYSEDFGPKKVSPIHIRPISPTRMNNPHPAKEFMVWRHPVRIHEHKKAANPPPDVWRYLNERFYEDYLDEYNTGDAKNEVPVTNLAKIKFPGKKEKGARREINGISGKKAQLNTRQGGGNSNEEREPQRPPLRPPSPQSLMIHHTIKGNSLPLFKEWLKSATTQERGVLLGMLHVAHDDSEEVRLSRVVNDVLQCGSVEKVQEWLKSASTEERQTVLNVLETLAVATGEGDVHGLSYPALYPRLQHRHVRHHTFPVSLQQQQDSHHHHHPHSSHHSLRHHHHHHSSSHHSSSRKKHPLASSVSALEPGSQMGLVGKKIVKPQRALYDKNPEVWQNRLLKKKLGTSIVHPSGVFNNPQRDIGQHFTIHPEWPTA